MNARKMMRGVAVAATAAATVLGLQTVASASGLSTVYVSTNHSGSAGCLHADVTTIQKGVDLVKPGGTVIVCPGTYKESVTITKLLTLRGQDRAVIDATGLSYGIGIGADHVTVTGLTVKNAAVGLPGAGPDTCGAPPSAPGAPPGPLCAGIVTFAMGKAGPQAGNYLRILDNDLTGNVGFGIDVVSTHGSVIRDNEANGNGIGINVVDDLGIPVDENQIVDNEANHNLNGCGIALASHSGAGVTGNLVKENEADGNGLPAGGAGILLATPTPHGIVRDNRLVENSASGNGHAGIEVHIHVPDADVRGNSIEGNRIGRNNTGGDFADMHTTGIYLGSNSPLRIEVEHNTISNDFYGIFQAGPNVRADLDDNTFRNVVHRVGSVATFA